MLRYNYINKEWIVSPTAGRVYRASAAFSVALFFGCCALLFVGEIPTTVVPVVRLFVFAGVLGAGLTFVGMEYFLFRFDDSHALQQVVWFLVMLFPLLGPALYCFIVYSRSNALKSTYPKRPEGSI